MARKTIKEPDRILLPGRPDYDQCDNKVISARYTAVTFFPVAVLEQFRRFANLYFLCVGLIMFIGEYTSAFESAISPWTTLGPLAFVICVSLIVEGTADLKRHRNDAETNNAPCVILSRADEIDKKEDAQRDDKIMHGKDCVVNISKAFYMRSTSHPRKEESSSHADGDDTENGDEQPQKTPDIPALSVAAAQNVMVAYEKVRRMDIRQGHFVLVKNREMVPADIVLLASSNDQGSAYIETSSIDGETNLKLRTSPHLPKNVLRHLRDGIPLDVIEEEGPEDEHEVKIESIEDATKRLTRISYLGRPTGKSALDYPGYENKREDTADTQPVSDQSPRRSSLLDSLRRGLNAGVEAVRRASLPPPLEHLNSLTSVNDDDKYIAALTTEPPNPSVHTFSGKLTLPPLEQEGSCYDIPLDADNVLLRGAVLRNTEWAIGVAFFTGTDTKLVQNSFKTPSKFSQLDRLMNKTVLAILCIMFACIAFLSTGAVTTINAEFDALFYVGLNTNSSEPWPYLDELAPPSWSQTTDSWIQYFFLYVTLLSNFIPLSMYVTVEFITFCMLWFVNVDLEMYDDTTNTRAVARSTNVTDLGRVEYIFSDKTGTLTQNVMRFKRCSVDGMAFGTPIQKARPDEEDFEEEEEGEQFYPLRQLLVGQFKSPSAPGLEGLGGLATSEPGGLSAGQTLTFNAEMFLRVMSLCHTVVVEKDIDKKDYIDASQSVSSASTRSISSGIANMFRRNRTSTADSFFAPPLSVVSEENDDSEIGVVELGRGRTTSLESLPPGQSQALMKGPDGAPLGYAYQAESPDEGALVSAASLTFGFQVTSRDSAGIRLRVTSPSHLQDSHVTDGLRSDKLTLKHLAAETASELNGSGERAPSLLSSDPVLLREPREETWTILAVNRFDSDRKRMSILLRSPPELGKLPILFCKGADSSMLDPEVCSTHQVLQGEGEMSAMVSLTKPSVITAQARDVSALTTVSEGDENGIDEDGWEMAQMLGLQAHLGEFASEGLRTLVLGMRVLDEAECSSWLEEYKAASTSMKNRAELLTKAALKIETGLFLVGATAIEDKLQRKVPETIATLAKAGIKLWVLTGDKRETAIEIGYSTHVLTPKMHLSIVPDNGIQYVRAQMAMEFIRLVKMGKLPDYQIAQLDDTGPRTVRKLLRNWSFALGKCHRRSQRSLGWFLAFLLGLFGCKRWAEKKRDKLEDKEEEEQKRLKPIEQRRRVRMRADNLIQEWLESDEGKKQRKDTSRSPEGSVDELSLASEETPGVFSRASSAKSLLKDIRSSGKLTSAHLRELSLAQLTVQQAGEEQPLVDEDVLSMESFFPGNKDDLRGDFDKKKRTLLERLFAIDREVRKGRLRKHLKREKLVEIVEASPPFSGTTLATDKRDGPRALIIEGGALKHLLGDHELETMLFAVASNCEAVIACRSSPKQKALLVNLVRHNVKPEPITLAIGDGANDVGMIQEAHVGVGISGKEGKQAVNASDFAIAQFRFLEDLILIHGRWDFFRLSTVVLFSFYKNAVMAGILIVFAARTLYSGTPLFDQWLIAMLNFVAQVPIIVLGLFDRCLDKDYVRKNPIVYKATMENELITFRTMFRWILLVFVHLFTLYYFTVPQQSSGGGMTSAWEGLMRSNDRNWPGSGEGGDRLSVGTVTFTSMIILFAYKVLYESRSLIHGIWPAFTCRKGVGEGGFSRLAYTWIGVIYLSIGFYLFAIGIYSVVGRLGPSQFSEFTNMASHVLSTRTLSWMLLIFVPIVGIAFDVCGKVFSNLFYPTQTQIHVELESKSKAEQKKQNSGRMHEADTNTAGTNMAEP